MCLPRVIEVKRLTASVGSTINFVPQYILSQNTEYSVVLRLCFHHVTSTDTQLNSTQQRIIAAST